MAKLTEEQKEKLAKYKEALERCDDIENNINSVKDSLEEIIGEMEDEDFDGIDDTHFYRFEDEIELLEGAVLDVREQLGIEKKPEHKLKEA